MEPPSPRRRESEGEWGRRRRGEEQPAGYEEDVIRGEE